MARRHLVVAAAAGLGATVLLVVQAALLATIVERGLLHRATLGAVEPYLVGLAAAFAGRALLAFVGDISAQRGAASVVGGIRRRLVEHALALGPQWLAGERAGELSAVATRGVASLETYFGRYLPQLLLAAMAPIGILAWVASIDWVSALILLALLAAVPVAMVVFGRRAEQESTRQWRRLSSLSARFLELVQALPTLRAFGRARYGRREVVEATEALRGATMRTLRVAFLSSLALELIAGLGTGLVAMVLGLRLLGGSTTLYVALAVLLVSPEVFLPLRRAGAEFHASAEGTAAAERILSVLAEPAADHNGSAARSAAGSEAGSSGAGRGPGAPVLADLCHAPLRLEGVSVSYPGRLQPALRDVDLTVGPGEHLALVGPSGAGKSTVLSVLLGFVVPDRGSVWVGTSPLGDLDPATWLSLVGWVPQRPHLFSGTLADNLRIGDPGAEPTDLARVVEMSGLSELVGRLPAGLGTPVGEGGLSLSAGERQRVAIARVLLRSPRLVLMDEPAAHLDPAAEDALTTSLGPWLADRTVVVAAHRPQLLRRLDRTARLELPAEGASEGLAVGTLSREPLTASGTAARERGRSR